MNSEQITVAIIILINFQIKGHGQDKIRSNCGRRLVQHNALITNGFISKEGDWPWHAAIYHTDSTDIKYKCGGTVIHSNSILTAAHCVHEYGRPIAPYRVVVQLGKFNLKISGPNTQELEVFAIIPHPSYNSSNLENDIAIIRLSTEAAFNDYVQPICLYDRSKVAIEEVTGKFGTVIGWGVTETKSISYVLRQAVMPVVPFFECLNSNRDFFGAFLTDRSFCAGFKNGTSVCNGDSGGSITFEDNEVYSIRGIVSLTASKGGDNSRMCDSKEYVIFTDVAKYLTWIEEVVPEVKYSPTILENQVEVIFQLTDNIMWSYNCDFTGGDIENQISKQGDCWKLCSNNPECTHFHWISSYGGLCLMKHFLESKVKAVVKNGYNATCGWIIRHQSVHFQRSGIHRWSKDCEFIGGDYESHKSERDQCWNLCADNKECTHFTWISSYGGVCLLKQLDNNATASVKKDYDAICGWVLQHTIDGDIKFQLSGEALWSNGCQYWVGSFEGEDTKRDNCAELCLKNELCTHFTWHTTGGDVGYCHLQNTHNLTALPAGANSLCGKVIRPEDNGGYHFQSKLGLRWSLNCGFGGNNIGNEKAPLADCGKICAEHEECTHFSWNSQNGTCWLKTGSDFKPYRSLDADDACGFVVWDWIYEGSLIWHSRCENNEGDIENLKSTLNECIILCNKRADCRRFNWTAFEGGMCWLKGENARLAYVYDDEGKICGIKPI